MISNLLTPVQIDDAIEKDDHPLTNLYRLGFPVWNGEDFLIPRQFTVSRDTWAYISDKMYEVFGREGRRIWSDKGFMVNPHMADWIVNYED